jgi:hypothetical protein
VVVEYTARVLDPTFHWLFRHDKDDSFLQVWTQEAHMAVMSRAFVFLNCEIGAERPIIEEMQDITCILHLSNHGVAELVRWNLATIS